MDYVPLESHPPKPTKLVTFPPMTLRPPDAASKRQYLTVRGKVIVILRPMKLNKGIDVHQSQRFGTELKFQWHARNVNTNSSTHGKNE